MKEKYNVNFTGKTHDNYGCYTTTLNLLIEQEIGGKIIDESYEEVTEIFRVKTEGK